MSNPNSPDDNEIQELETLPNSFLTRQTGTKSKLSQISDFFGLPSPEVRRGGLANGEGEHVKYLGKKRRCNYARSFMCIYIDDEHGEDGTILRQFYAVTYSPEVLSKWPWGDEEFDCVIVVCTPVLDRQLADDIADDVVKWNVDYVHTTGAQAELLHDLIDETNVMAGLQSPVDERVLMTTWHEEARTISEMTEVAADCFGGNDHVLVLVVGAEPDLNEVVKQVRHRLMARQ